VPPGDPRALAGALRQAAAHGQDLAAQARDDVRRDYSAQAAAQAFLADLEAIAP